MMENFRTMKKNKGNKKMWSFFLDLKSAFDSVDHEIEFRKMREVLHIDDKLVNTIQ